MLAIWKVKVNYLQTLAGTGKNPQFSWVIKADHYNVVQTAYEMKIIKQGEELPVYCSGKVYTEQSAHVIADSFRMESLTTYEVYIKVWDNWGEISQWSDPCIFISALLSEEEWCAPFISMETEKDKDISKGTYVRGCFYLDKPVKKAYMVSTALGLYHSYINGEKAGRDEMTPGWTVYRSRLLYQTYDVTDLVQEGENVWSAHLGAGWYKGKMGIDGVRNMGGKVTAFSGQLLIRYQDGTTKTVVTDRSWKGCDSPILFSEIYDGEIYDSRMEQEGWNQKGFDDSAWNYVRQVEQRTDILVPQDACKLREIFRIPAKEIFVTPEGDTIVDFGQNMAGWVHVSVDGKAGEKVVLNHFEVLDSHGNVYMDNLRTAKETLVYICNGKGKTVYRPAFTYQGFRYLKVAAYPGIVKKENFIAYAVSSDMEEIGSFSCSDVRINQLQHNIEWGLMSNFFDVPTDCPQRDERLGWTGDAQIFCRTAAYLRNVYPFFSKWLKDLAAEQSEEGAVSHVVPNVLAEPDKKVRQLEKEGFAAAGWADAAVIIPWTMYLMYGDTRIIEEQYESMKAWIDFMNNRAEDYIWEFPGQFGDWASLDAEEGSCQGATPVEMISTAYFAYSTNLFAKMAGAIGNTEDKKQYEKLKTLIIDSYRRHFIHGGHISARTQTAQIITLYFGLAEEKDRPGIVHDLLQLLEENGGHINTGFIGTPYFCHALSQNGCVNEAFELLMKEDFPSWLYQIKMGATTIWEHWDGIKPDGTMWSPGMNSFNHYAYGAIGEWLYRAVAGIEADEKNPGYKHIIFQPHTFGTLNGAAAHYESIYGTVRSAWSKEKETVFLTVEVPVNSTAEIVLEQGSILVDSPTQFNSEKGHLVAHVGSGIYQILYKKLS